MVIIGLSGHKKSGKDTFADMLIQLIGEKHCQKIGFADALYEEVAKATGHDVSFIKKHKDNFRLILQGWGTNFRRELCSKDYWTEQLLRKVLNCDRPVIFIPDVRFLDEVEIVKYVGGKLVRINREDCDIDDLHPSETELDTYTGWDYFIQNDGSLEDLQHMSESFYANIIKTKKEIEHARPI